MEEEYYVSRSQKKRESTALQKAGEELAALSPGALKQFDLSPDLEDALAFWHTLKNHEARRRHMQFIGKLMREADNKDAILEKLETFRQQHHEGAAAFHHIEKIRDRLLSDDETERTNYLDALLGETPALERKKLRHLVQSALAEKEKGRPPKSARQLFRYLKESCSSNQQENAENGEATS